METNRTDQASEAIEFLRRRGRVIFCAFALTIIGVLGFVQRMEPRYESELKILVSRTRVNMPASPERLAPGTVPSDIADSEISSEIELLRSRELMEKTLERCGLAQRSDAAGFVKSLRKLSKELVVSPVKKTGFISVKYAAADADLAARVPNTIVSLYLEKHTEVRGNRQTSHFFTQQAAAHRQELAQAQGRLAGYEQKHDAALLEQQKQNNLSRVSQLENLFEETRMQKRDAEDRLRLLGEQLSTLPETVNAQSRKARSESLIERWKSQLLDLQHKRTQLLTKFDPGYRLVQEVDTQIADTNAALEREGAAVVDRTDTLNPLRQSVEADILRTQAQVAGLKARETVLARDLQEKQGRQRGLSTLTAARENLARDLRIAEENYLLYEKKQEESRIADAMDREKILNVAVIEPAAPPLVPTDRHRSVFVLLGVVFAMLLSAGAGLAADAFDPPVRSPRDLEKATGLPVVLDLTKGERSWS